MVKQLFDIAIAVATGLAISVVFLVLIETGSVPGWAMLIGGGVGGVELLGRYRHAPLRAILTFSGLCYVLINVLASWAAFHIIDVTNVLASVVEQSKAAGIGRSRDLLVILTAGFGSLVFMRSSIFRIRVGDSDVGIGPAAILDTLLLVADRGVDRCEAVARARDVGKLVSRVGDVRTGANLLTKYSLALMQNVDDKTTTALTKAVNDTLADQETPENIKMDIIALRLGVVVGSDVLEAAAVALGDRLSLLTTTAAPDPKDIKAAIDKSGR